MRDSSVTVAGQRKMREHEKTCTDCTDTAWCGEAQSIMWEHYLGLAGAVRRSQERRAAAPSRKEGAR